MKLVYSEWSDGSWDHYLYLKITTEISMLDHMVYWNSWHWDAYNYAQGTFLPDFLEILKQVLHKFKKALNEEIYSWLSLFICKLAAYNMLIADDKTIPKIWWQFF